MTTIKIPLHVKSKKTRKTIDKALLKIGAPIEITELLTKKG